MPPARLNALAAFIAPVATPEKKKTTTTTTTSGPRPRNEYLESLFARPPIQARAPQTLAPQPAAPIAPPQPVRYHTEKLNPAFADEPQVVPAADLMQRHYGEKCESHERVLRVVRYGRVYKRKAATVRWAKVRLDAPAGKRWCRFCADFQPLDAFYTNVVRYVCRKHHAERKTNTFRARVRLDCTESLTYGAWYRLMKHSRDILGLASLNYDRSDIRSLAIHAGVPWGIRPHALPIDPARPLRPRNVALVSSITYSQIMEMYRHTCSRALYIAHVQRCNLIPHHMDVGCPDDPFHNPAYRRVDLDAAALLAAEQAAGIAECVDRTMLEALRVSEPPAPWNEGAGQLLAVATCMRVRLRLRMRRGGSRASGGSGSSSGLLVLRQKRRRGGSGFPLPLPPINEAEGIFDQPRGSAIIPAAASSEPREGEEEAIPNHQPPSNTADGRSLLCGAAGRHDTAPGCDDQRDGAAAAHPVGSATVFDAGRAHQPDGVAAAGGDREPVRLWYERADQHADAAGAPEPRGAGDPEAVPARAGE